MSQHQPLASHKSTVSFELAPWDLSELLADPGPATVAARTAALDRDVASFEACRSELVPGLDPHRFAEILGAYERLTEQAGTLGAYGGLWFAADTQSAAALAYRNKLQPVLTGVGNRTMFFTLWWKALSDADAEALLPDPAREPHRSAHGPRAGDRRHYLLDLRRQKPYTLDEAREQLINLKDADGSEALLTLYSILTNRIEFTLMIDGEPRTLTRDELMSHAFSPDPQRREAVYRELYTVYAKEATPLGQIYVHRVRDWHNEGVTLRGHSSPIGVRNRDNDIPDAAVDTLLEVVREHTGLFHRYFRLKAKWLGLERLRRYDIYAPVAASPDPAAPNTPRNGGQRTIPYAEGVRMVLDTFSRFDDSLAAFATRVFSERHIDAEPRKGKKGGAFCATVLPNQTPWVLANYTGRVRDVATLAHELGHAVHSMLAAHHTVLTQHPSLPLAETASVFAEMLMTDRLLDEEPDRLARRDLLLAAIDDIFATVLRQAYFVQFEIAAHRAVLDGASTEELSELYFGLLREQFGDAVEVAPEFRHEWLSIPHLFQTPFYCYAYCFGQLLVLALYRRYQQQGPAFKPGYLRMLAYGGAARPEDILAEVGVDIADPAFWRGGFAVVADLIDELEQLGA